MPSPPQLDWRTARILGVDPGTVMAVCLGDGQSRRWQTWDMRKKQEAGAKLAAVELFVRGWIHFGVDVVVFEDAAYSQHRNVIAQSVLSAMRGVVQKVASEAGLPCVAMNPSTLKSFAGCCGKTTRRDKEAMVRAAAGVLGVTVANHNEADAVWLEALARHRLKAGVLFDTPKSRRRAARKSPERRLFR